MPQASLRMLQNSLSCTIPCYLLAFLSLFLEVKLDNFPARQSSKSSLWISSRLEYIFLQASFKNAQQFYIICLPSCCMNVHSEIQFMLAILFVCVCVCVCMACCCMSAELLSYSWRPGRCRCLGAGFTELAVCTQVCHRL
jgi:hypothetical protein